MWLLLLACLEEPEEVSTVTLEDACGTSEYGDDNASSAAKAALDRTNCYRNLLGLNPGLLDPALDEAAQSHADYMSRNNTVTHQQIAGTGGFTGEWVWDRFEAAGYPIQNGNSWGEVVAYGYEDPADAIDGWVETVYHRIPYTTPDWRELGYGQSGLYSAMGFVTRYPAQQSSAVLYPVQGQLDVPPTFQSDEEWPDPAPDHSLVGMPITVSVGAEDATNSQQNPYQLVLNEASLSGPDGDLEFLALEPDNDSWLFNTIALVPVEPLQPGSRYEGMLDISWIGGDALLTVDFTTAQEEEEER